MRFQTVNTLESKEEGNLSLLSWDREKWPEATERKFRANTGRNFPVRPNYVGASERAETGRYQPEHWAAGGTPNGCGQGLATTPACRPRCWRQECRTEQASKMQAVRPVAAVVFSGP